MAARTYAVWNNKGGVGKSFLTFALGSEIAHAGDGPVLLVDVCPQANLSEIVLGGNGAGADHLEDLCEGQERQTVGGYFDERINSPQKAPGTEANYAVQGSVYNPNLPDSLWLLAGDPGLEVQAQAMNQIAGQTLPSDTWKNVHLWLHDLIKGCVAQTGAKYVIIDCNPSFAVYTELAMTAADRLVIPCSCDGSSARAIRNLGSLLYGIGTPPHHQSASYSGRMKQNKLRAPEIHVIAFNRSTQYSKKASKAFGAVFDAIRDQVKALHQTDRSIFSTEEPQFREVPDAHSVAVICSHLGRPLYSITPGQYDVYDTRPQVNEQPLDRYKQGLASLVSSL